MLKTVIDTNVLISALHNKAGIPGQILQLVYNREITPIVTDEILAEYERVVHYDKFNFSANDKKDAIEVFGKFISKTHFVQLPIPGVPDDDLKFVHVALQYDADCLITGNTKHFAVVSKVINVITPAEFIKRYENRP